MLAVMAVVTGFEPASPAITAVPAVPVPNPAFVRIGVIGDYGSGGSAERDVAALVDSWQPDLIVTTGDNNYPVGAAETIDFTVGQFFHSYIHPYQGSYGEGASDNRFFPVLGNHDWGTAAGTPPVPVPYLDFFTLPEGPGEERYYTIRAGAVQIFALDSDPHEPHGITDTSRQADWLRAELAASDAPWKLVVLHHPPFSSSAVHGSSPELQWPFRVWGASAVLAGHDHAYERILRDGIPYFVNGIGGASLYEMGTPIEGSEVRYNEDYGAMLVEATPLTITFRLIDRTGIEHDLYTMDVTQPLPGPTPSPVRFAAERRVAASSDDAEEAVPAQTVNLASTDLEMTIDPGAGTEQVVGMRFPNVQVPRDAVILSAYIEFTTDETDRGGTQLAFVGEASDDALPFTTEPGNVTSRSLTAARVEWSPVPEWPSVGSFHRTPDLAAVVQEIVSRPGWRYGNALALLVTGSGQRTAVAYDGVAGLAPLLHVDYTLGFVHFLPFVHGDSATTLR